MALASQTYAWVYQHQVRAYFLQTMLACFPVASDWLQLETECWTRWAIGMTQQVYSWVHMQWCLSSSVKYPPELGGGGKRVIKMAGLRLEKREKHSEAAVICLVLSRCRIFHSRDLMQNSRSTTLCAPLINKEKMYKFTNRFQCVLFLSSKEHQFRKCWLQNFSLLRKWGTCTNTIVIILLYIILLYWKITCIFNS